MTNDQLDELERLAKAAKRGPWKDKGGANTHFFDRRVMSSFHNCVAFADAPEAAFIAAANPAAVLELIAAVRAGPADRIHEVMDEGDGCWVACSGCQEGVDGYVSAKDYPYSETFKCQPGGGCSECGGLGVLWDDTDYDAMAAAMLADMREEEALDDVIAAAWLELGERDDRTSPEEYPDMCLINREELVEFMRRAASATPEGGQKGAGDHG